MTTPFNTVGAERAFALDVKGVAPKDVVPDALILQTSTKAGFVEGDAPSVLVPYVSLEDQPGFVAEAGDIPESDPDDSQVQIFTGKIALLFSVSRELWGTADTKSLLSEASRLAIVKKANGAYLSQADPSPASTPPAGLFNQNLGSVSTTPGPDLDAFVDAIASVESAGGSASHIVMSPAAWAFVSKLKTDSTDSTLPIVGTGSVAAPRQLFSVPVLVDSSVPTWRAIVLDSRSILSAYGQLQIATSEHYKFGADSVSVRATWRFGAKVVDPNRVVEVSVLDLS